MRVVHYLNQFFAGFGGEDSAGTAPVRLEGAVGPGRALGLEVAATLACGDDYFGEHEEAALAATPALARRAERPDVLVCGPSFGSGRYGYACGMLAREAARRGIPAVCAMHPESPGVLAAGVPPTSSRRDEWWRPCGRRCRRMAALARRLAARRADRRLRRGGLPAARAAPQRALRADRRSPRRRDAPRQAPGQGLHGGRGALRLVSPPPPMADLSDRCRWPW